MSLEDDGGWLVDSDFEGCVWHGRQWTESDGILLDWAEQTCNPAHFSCGDALASETSGLSTQAVAYDVEILQFGSCLGHKELYQFRYVLSRRTCVLHGSCIGIRGEHSPIDPNDVVIASRQISWKEYSVLLQSLCNCYYKLFSSGMTIWLVLKLCDLKLWLQWILRLLNSFVGCTIMSYGRQILTFRRVMMSTSHGRM